MGGDLGPQPSLEAALVCLDLFPRLQLQWIGPKDQLNGLLTSVSASQQHLLPRINVIKADDVIEMTDDVLVALRQKQNSSMSVALQQVAAGQADACVTCGNSAALMALSRQLLATLPGFERPAFASHIPTSTNPCLVVDMGANLAPSAEQLTQYAIAGQALEQALQPAQQVSVGLLNIASEARKGQPEVQEAHELLGAHKELNYHGFVEPQEVFKGKVNVLVCDGYAGNVLIKSAEGVSQMLSSALYKHAQQQGDDNAYLQQKVVQPLQSRFDARKLNGAFLLGLQSLVVKSHSYADTTALVAAITSAVQYLEMQFTEHVADAITE
jgi:glycerol-3-phosphate acyltransferase PlsX